MFNTKIVYPIQKGMTGIKYLILDMGPDHKLILAFTFATILSMYLPYVNGSIIRYVLGFSIVMFMPGYAFISALYPGKADIGGIERAAYSVGLSIVLVPMIGLLLNYTPAGITLTSMSACLVLFTVVCTMLANALRHGLPFNERFSIDFGNLLNKAKTQIFQADKTPMDKAFTWLIIISILASIFIGYFVVATIPQGDKFTEFYILGTDGKIGSYPTNFQIGDEKPVLVNVVNHERRAVNYNLIIIINNSSHPIYTDQFTLADNETREKPVMLKPDVSGTNLKVMFLLYSDGNMTSPYRECHLYVNVTNNVSLTRPVS